MANVEVAIASVNAGTYSGAGTNYLIQTPAGVLYMVYSDNSSDVAFRKSSDGGLSWSVETVVFAGTVTALSVWYDRWSDIAAGLIHCAYTESDTDDTLYRSIDTESSDTLGTQTTIFAGASTAGNGMLSITRARGGNLCCRTCIDSGAEGGFYRSTDVGATWGARTINETLAGFDQMILLPGWAADNQDVMGIFYDNSATEISRQLYDDSADTWSESSIATSITMPGAATCFPTFAAAVDIANSRNVVVCWTNVDSANADLRCWTVTESAITETATNVVLNSTDDQGLCSIGIDTANSHWYVFYFGKSDGSETWNTAMKMYYKISTDAGATWGAETQATSAAEGHNALWTAPRFTGVWKTAYHHTSTGVQLRLVRPCANPRAQLILGV